MPQFRHRMNRLGAYMESEILEQPHLLAQKASEFQNQCHKLQGLQRPQLIVFAARGSSNNAALYARYLFEVGLGIPAMIAAPSVGTQFGVQVKFPPALGIGISQSGAAPDVTHALHNLKRHGHPTIAITNTPQSPIQKAADETICLGAGTENSIPATKTYTLSLLALLQLARQMGAPYPDPQLNLPDEKWTQKARQAAQKDAQTLTQAPIGFTLGRAFSFGTACEIALKLVECALIPCQSFSVADFQHGPRALAQPGTWLLSAEGKLSKQLIHQAKLITPPEPSPALHPTLRPFFIAIYGQWLALEAARIKGLDPDDPQGLTKITQTL